ncbi:DUF4190 domain-containing protein [Nocardia sp. NBC_01388]|uniref:DUF4190 domain-containing protein n=1 Tax=Nocardia sp. NBC_01388 TaxID=2903596 RepID=UPI0032491355
MPGQWGVPQPPITQSSGMPPAGQPMWTAPPGGIAPYPYAYPAAPPPPPQGTNGLAIAAFVTGLLGMCLLALPFGVISLTQVKDRNQQGKGLAIAGLVLSGVWALVAVAVAAVAVQHAQSQGATDVDYAAPPPSFAAPTTASGYTLLRNLKDGDCVNGVREGATIGGAVVTACTAPHDGEVFLVFPLPTWGSEQQAKDYAETKCEEPFDKMQAQNPNLTFLIYHPGDELGWRKNPSVQCVAIDDNAGKLTTKLPR